LGFFNPLLAVIAAIAFLIILIYKRVNLGIALNATALFLALLAVDLAKIPVVIYETTVDLPTVSVVLATFCIMLLSQLYKETGIIDRLSESIGRLINNPKAVLMVLPAVIGLLPVAGGALMSAPLVEKEAEKLQMKPDRKAYVNLWFRHTVFPVYPLSPVIITTTLLTGVSIPLIIMRQIPVAIVMAVVGYVIGFRNTVLSGKKEQSADQSRNRNLRDLLVSFSPILTTIAVAIALSLGGVKLLNGFDVVVAIIIGLIIMIAVTRLRFKVFTKPFKTWGIYGITFAAYGAFLLRNVMINVGISNVFSSFMTNGSTDLVLFLAVAPAVLGLLTGSPAGGVAVSISILSGLLTMPFAPKVAALIYISSYLGYTIAPTHLCFTFTADYFKCSLGRMYRYVLPSFLVTFPIGILVYFLL